MRLLALTGLTILCTSVVLPKTLSGQGNIFFTLANVKARPLAMGGAFMAIDADLASISYNPAAYFLKDRTTEPAITFFFNPASAVAGGVKNEELFQGAASRVDDALLSVGLLLRSISLRVSSFQLGFLFGEESLNLPDSFHSEQFVRVSGYRQNHAHTMIARLKLADKVALGATASWMIASRPGDDLEPDDGVGFSYGILLKPEKGLTIGVSFFNLPDTLNQFRVPLERIVDEAVNVGISYEFPTKTRLAVDVRNLGEENQQILREFHFGFEQVLLSQVALRGGYFKADQGNNVYSFGVSLLEGTRILQKNTETNYYNFFVNYAFVYEEGMPADSKWHFLSLLLRL